MISHLCIDLKIPVIRTNGYGDTIRFLYTLAKREQLKLNRKINNIPRRKPKDTKDIQEFLVSSIPGIGIPTARELLCNFKSIKNLSKAEEKELRKTKNIGKLKARLIKKILNHDY